MPEQPKQRTIRANFSHYHALELYEAGAPDSTIGDVMLVGHKTIRRWRIDNDLLPNRSTPHHPWTESNAEWFETWKKERGY